MTSVNGFITRGQDITHFVKGNMYETQCDECVYNVNNSLKLELQLNEVLHSDLKERTQQ